MLRLLKEHSLTLLLIAIFTAGIFMRPPLPVDETRYLTVAWEMWFKSDWAHLTYNFEPYHHKPPLLFWLINVFWYLFAITRWAGTIPSLLASLGVLFLTGRLAQKLMPAEREFAGRARLLLLGSFPFLLYGSLI